MTRVFTWGMACYGALGVPEHLRPKQRKKPPLQAMHRPARCGFAETERVRDVACGYGFTVFALDGKESHIMGTGINKDGQIGKSVSIIVSQAARFFSPPRTKNIRFTPRSTHTQ